MGTWSHKAIGSFCAFVALSGYARADDIPTLCHSNEQTVWSCHAHTKTYSVCASKLLRPNEGYLQYRAATLAKLEFQFPEKPVPPKGLFQYSVVSHGAILDFKKGAYAYSIGEDLNGSDSVSVTKQGKTLAAIECQTSTQSLTYNTTMELMSSAGISQQN
jgi:hypothetical protein